MRRILIIDDEKNICVSLSYALEDRYEVVWTQSPGEGLAILQEQPVDLVLLDLKLGSYNGIEVLKQIKGQMPALPVIMMTGFGSIDSSVEAIKAGAYHYVAKPIAMEELRHLIQKALEHGGLRRQVRELHRRLNSPLAPAQMVGRAPAMEALFRLIDKVKNINSNILVLGESGSGKELVARAIHENSQRKNKPFEAVNCSAIPLSLLESEFFGHKKGAFTGAEADRKGKFEICHEGTLFLDEIGEMDLGIQAKLLRVIQDQEVTPVGSNQKIQVDVRLIAATNRDLKKGVEEGTFREDLYYRLNVITLEVPPLRQRKEDLPVLIQYFIGKYNERFDKDVKGIRPEAMRQLENYDFPGNVRELENLIERGVALTDQAYVGLEDLPELIPLAKDGKEGLNLAGHPLAWLEKQAILQTLQTTGGHRRKAAALLGITERTLRNKLELYGEQAEDVN